MKKTLLLFLIISTNVFGQKEEHTIGYEIGYVIGQLIPYLLLIGLIICVFRIMDRKKK